MNTLDKPTVLINLSAIKGAYNLKMTPVGTFTYQITSIIGPVDPGVYPIYISANTTTNHTNKKFLVDVQLSSGSFGLMVTSVTLENPEPLHSSNDQIFVSIYNPSPKTESFQLLYIDSFKGNSLKIVTSTGNPSPTLTIQPFTSITVTTTWINVGGNGPASGTHVLYVNFTNVAPYIPSKGGNTSLTVLPKILLVDDEGISPNNPKSILSFYSSMFSYTSYSADLQLISPGQQANIGGYDLIIWITGFIGLVTYNQGQQIQNFINQGGSVLLISNNSNSYSYWGYAQPVKITSPNTIKYTNFTSPNFGVNITCNVIYPSSNLNATIFNSGNPLAQFYGLNKPSVIYGINSNGGKYIFVGYEFSTMYIYQQDYVLNKMVMWLSNINIRYGNDLALVDLRINPVNPYFMQNVTLSFVIMNYSPKPLTDVSLEVLIDNSPINGQPIYTINYINGNGTYLIFNVTWQATTPGTHSIYAYVNPFHTIPEVNYNNNALNSIVNSTIFVKYSTLLIWVHDQTDSNKNITSVINTLNNLGISYTFLEYNQGSSNKILPNINSPSSKYYFLKYNLVIIDFNNTGNLNNFGGNSLSYAIYNYITNKNATKYPYSLLIIGENSGYALNQNSTILQALKIQQISLNQNNKQNYINLNGINYNSINLNLGPLGSNVSRGYGIYYLDNNYITTIKLNENAMGTGIFNISNSNGYNQPVRLSNAVIENISNIIVTIFPYSIENIKGLIQNHTNAYSPSQTTSNPITFAPPNSVQYAKNFLMMNFMIASRYLFNAPLPEILSTDILLNSNAISLNNYYLFTITIRNLGIISTYVTLQGYEQTSMFYSSQPLYLVGSKMNSITTVTATVIWKPTYASSPNPEWIRFVLIPASSNITVSPMQEALISVPVYYFYDNGSSLYGWTHYNTIAYITGEPLFGLTSPYTSIATNWSNVYNYTDTNLKITHQYSPNYYFSYPSSYYIQDVIDYGTKQGGFSYVALQLPTVTIDMNSVVTLSWYWKYSIAEAQNGLFLMVDISTSGSPQWYQVALPYNSNPDLGNIISVSDPLHTGLSAKIYEAYNGVSGGGTFGWEYNIINTNNLYVMDPNTGLPLPQPINVQGMKLTFIFYYISPDIKASSYSGSNTPGAGTYIDNVVLSITNGGNDGWRVIKPNQNNLYYGISTNGVSYLGFNGSPTYYLIADYNNNQGYPTFNSSLWDHLITPSIDLFNALSASLTFVFKANIAQGLYGDGWPPDMFLLSISRDNGATWSQIYSPPTYPTPILSDKGAGQSGGGTIYYNGKGCLPANGANDTYWLTVTLQLNNFVGQNILLDFQIITNNGWSYSNLFIPWHAVGYTSANINPFLGFYMTNIFIQGYTYFTPIYVNSLWT
ncbi:MAG: hypothetical protein ACP5L4_06135 [Thermoplasmata archaeon]